MAYVEMGTLDGYYDEVNNEKGITADVEVFHVSGKIRTDTPLLTTSQDVAGAINELFTLDPGGGDKWAYPTDWIQIPSPASNEVYCVGTISLSTNRQLHVSFQNWGGEDGTCVIDWGDGNQTDLGLQSSATHTYVDGTGHLTDIGMEQFLVKITMSNPADWGRVTMWAVYDYAFCLALAYGADTIMPLSIDDIRTIHQVQLPNVTTLSNGVFGSCQALKKIITPTKLTAIDNVSLSGCYSLEQIDLSEVETIGINGISNCHSLKKLDLPKCTTAYISNCYALREINAPLLTNATISSCYSLSKLVHADGATLNISSCYNLYPNPAP